MLTSRDLHDIEALFEPRLQEIDGKIEKLNQKVDFGYRELSTRIDSHHTELSGKIDNLTSSVDQFLHSSRRHEDELVVVRTQTGRIRDVLVEKGIATEDELSLFGKKAS